MGNFHLNDLPKEKRIQMIGEFYDVIDSLKSRKEIRSFFKDLLTADEIAMLMRRIEVAVLLEANFNYREISQLIGVGKGTVNNIQKTLTREGDGYKIVIERLLENRKKRLIKKEKEGEIQDSYFKKIKKRHPHIFLLHNLIDEVSESIKDDSSKNKASLLFTPSLISFENRKEEYRKNHKNENKKTS